MGIFEDTLGGLGRWIDDRIAGLRAGPGVSAGERVRAVRESMSEGVRHAKASASERIDRVRANAVPRDDPSFQRRLLVVGLVLMLVAGVGLGVFVAPKLLGLGGSGLSKEDIAALQKMQERGKNAGATNVFVTTPPPGTAPSGAPSGALGGVPAPASPVPLGGAMQGGAGQAPR